VAGGHRAHCRRTINFCFCSCDLVCGGEIVLWRRAFFKVPDIDKIPEAVRAKVMASGSDRKTVIPSVANARHFFFLCRYIR